MSYQAFICYKRNTAEDFATHLKKGLEEVGIRTFLDITDIPKKFKGTQEWATSRDNAINESKYFIFIITQSFDSSTEIKKELTIARSSKDKQFIYFKHADLSSCLTIELIDGQVVDLGKQQYVSFNSKCDLLRNAITVIKEHKMPISISSDEDFFKKQLDAFDLMENHVSDYSKGLTKIKSRGYWQIIIRPITFQRGHISDLSNGLKIIEECKVSLRGWDYPHMSYNEPAYCGIDYLESVVDWSIYKELWRFYDSGQFVHFRGFKEDWFEESHSGSDKNFCSPKIAFDAIGAIHAMTEIYQFATRLANKQIFDKSAYISIRLYGLANRTLTSFDIRRTIDSVYRCKIDYFPIEKEIPLDTLIEKGDEIAIEQVIEIFKRFDWHSPQIDTLKKIQRNFLERRF
ncbi:MAG: toll/interleukin-1 receptor domain-containing protein [Candidatus Bathyarchaeota archaeon]|nr:toll/interleukin-1 receptor domain-containing protein [Candidatus Termiticorpusculum sp.]